MMRKAGTMTALALGLVLCTQAGAGSVLSVEDFYGAFTFVAAEPGKHRNGFIRFNLDHTWYRVSHLDKNRDRIPEEIEVRRGDYRIVRGEDGEPVLRMNLENGKLFGTPEMVRFHDGAADSFELAGVSYHRRRRDEPYFDHSRNPPIREEIEQCALWVRSRPATRVFIDGRYRGDTPIKLDDIPPGEHELALKLPAIGVDHREQVLLEPGKILKVARKFLGSLLIRVGRPVRVFDRSRRKIGAAPGKALKLPVGTTLLILIDEKGLEKRVPVKIRLNETTTLSTPFEELDPG